MRKPPITPSDCLARAAGLAQQAMDAADTGDQSAVSRLVTAARDALLEDAALYGRLDEETAH